MKKIFNIIILSLIYLSVFSQAQTFENRESKLIIREKLNNNAGIININTADINSIEDSIAVHRELIDNIETGGTADLTPLYDSVSVHRTAIDNLSAMPATNLAPLYDSVFSHRTEIDALNAIPVTNLTPLYDSVAVHRSELDNIEITSITGLADSLAVYTAKETNATHTGDVTGNGELTITEGVIDESKLNASVNASLMKADNSIQNTHPSNDIDEDDVIKISSIPSSYVKNISDLLDASTEGEFNLFLGNLAGGSNLASYNTCLGALAGRYTIGNANLFLGAAAGYSNISGAFNMFFGYLSGYSNKTGSGNVFVGCSAGRYIEGGSLPAEFVENSIAIGKETRPKTSNDENTIIIGVGVTGNGSNTTTIGNDDNTDTYISGNLHLTGEVTATNITEGAAALVSAPSISAIQYADDAVQFDVALNPADSKFYGACKIVVIGSSTTAGTGAEAGYSCVDILENWVEIASDAGTLTNLALNGQVTWNLMPTGYTGGGAYSVNETRNITAALALDPDIIVIGLPSNDQSASVATSSTIANFHRIIREATCRGVKVVVMDIAPRSGVGSNYQYPLLDFFSSNYNYEYSKSFAEFSDSDLTWVTQYYNDDIHPNSMAHVYLGQKLVDACANIFEDENEVKYTIIERSTDNVNFTEQTVLRNNAKSYYDYNLSSPNTYYYRTKVKGKNYIDSEYSDTLSVNVSSTDDPQYVSSEIGLIADNTISITFNRNTTISGLTQISLTASGGTLTPSAVVSGNGTGTVSISLNRSITYDETISISITAGSEIVNASTSTPLSIAVSGESVTNNVIEPSPPVYVSSEVGNIGDSILTVTFDINATVTGATGMSLVASGGACTFEAVHAGSGTAVVQFSLSRAIVDGETVSLTILGTNNITSTSSGISFAGISSQSVVNNVSSSSTPDYTYRLNFGNTNLATSPWMNISSSNSSIETVDAWTTILDENGTNNGVLIGLKAGYPVQETQAGGISYTGADFEANCGLDFLYRDNGSSIYDITGLPVNAIVNVKFLASRNTTSTDRVTLYTIGSETQTLDAAMNSTLIANFDAVANASGVLTFEWGINTGSTYAYLNAMIIEVTNP